MSQNVMFRSEFDLAVIEDEREGWWERAACRGMDTEIFFYKDTYATRAKQVCRGCPVRTECLQEALKTEPADHRHGIWGGLSSGERRTLSKKLREQARNRAREQGMTPG